jgi:hypothetical protein
MYWSGLISETTSDNWQGTIGIWVSCIGGIILVAPFFWSYIIDPILEKFS